MGYWKDRQIQEWDQGWSFVDDDRMVCAECFEEYAIRDFIRDNATETSCSYCGRSAEEEIAAPMNEVLRLIGESLDYEYDDPNDAGVPVEGGEYVFDTMSTREVFAGLDTITENEDVMEEILNAFSDSAWVDKPFYSLAEDDELRYGWRDFVKAVKYERRYLFLKPKRKKGVALMEFKAFVSGFDHGQLAVHMRQAMKDVERIVVAKALSPRTEPARRRDHPGAKSGLVGGSGPSGRLRGRSAAQNLACGPGEPCARRLSAQGWADEGARAGAARAGRVRVAGFGSRASAGGERDGRVAAALSSPSRSSRGWMLSRRVCTPTIRRRPPHLGQ